MSGDSLPVTIICGASDSGRTGLIKHLRESAPRVAVIQLTQESYASREAAGKLLGTIADLAGEGACHHLLIGLDGQGDPTTLARMFAVTDSEGRSFSEIAFIASTIAVVDATSFLRALQSGLDCHPVSADTMAEQIEAADVVFLEHIEALAEPGMVKAVIAALNPRARIAFGRISLDTSRPSMAAPAEPAQPGWRRLITSREDFHDPVHNISCFVWRARRPFHPERFWHTVNRSFPGLFRVKGFFWLATRMDFAGGLAKAGNQYRQAAAGSWWAAVARERWPAAAHKRAQIENEFVEPYGDRRQLLAFMGIGMDATELRRRLALALLTDGEITAGDESWKSFPDPFPAWHSQTHHHDHTHD